MSYVDGFLIAVPTANKDAYRGVAESAAAIFKAHGALAVVEAWGDDVPEGKVNSMRSAVLLKPDETVVFSWIVWPSKAARDAGNAAFMADPLMQAMSQETALFDGTRMIFGGFETLLSM